MEEVAYEHTRPTVYTMFVLVKPLIMISHLAVMCFYWFLG